MYLNDALNAIAGELNLDADTLIAYAAEDNVGGFHMDPALRTWTTGSMWEVDGQFIYALIRALRPLRVLECGVGNACTTAHILTALDANGSGELVSLDPTPYSTAKLDEHPRWTFHRIDAVTWLCDNPAEQFEVVIEDAMHDYEQVVHILSQVKPRQPRLVLSHDGEHALVGADVRQAWRDVYGDFHTVLIDPSDCGFAWRVQ